MSLGRRGEERRGEERRGDLNGMGDLLQKHFFSSELIDLSSLRVDYFIHHLFLFSSTAASSSSSSSSSSLPTALVAPPAQSPTSQSASPLIAIPNRILLASDYHRLLLLAMLLPLSTIHSLHCDACKASARSISVPVTCAPSPPPPTCTSPPQPASSLTSLFSLPVFNLLLRCRLIPTARITHYSSLRHPHLSSNASSNIADTALPL
eukprot:749842-Hanusia_phi.AAC.1